MKKIILAVASVMALGLFASCQREISGSLDVNENVIANGDSWQSAFDYSVTGSSTHTDTETVYNKIGDYNSKVTTTAYTLTPTGDIQVVETKNRNRSGVRYTYSFVCDVVKTTTTVTKASATADPVTRKTTQDKRQDPSLSWTVTFTLDYYDGKLYRQEANKDGSKTVVSGVIPTAATLDLSKFADTSSKTTVTYQSGINPSTSEFVPVVYPEDSVEAKTYFTKTTSVDGGWSNAFTLTKK